MELGFLFYPPAHPQALGHPQLDAILYLIPTHEHFDPHQITLPIETEDKGVQNLTFYHPADDGVYRVGLGRVVLENLEHKEVEAFTFGGQLEITAYTDHTLCRLKSPAPIFDLGLFAEDELELVYEYEAEAARLRASWRREDLDFDQRLAQIDPRTLFLALTAAVEQRLRTMPVASRTEKYWQFRHSLHTALSFVEPDGNFPAEMITVESLFSN